ncbi:MAG: 23S rRNA (adenine(2503)-C(2))-methyltransferase RlmN [Clostridiales bacterium]|nr:23S rRNA (adenine(2503)-C(2))-methyltransferase RlmN [Clostridiales bacterium]
MNSAAPKQKPDLLSLFPEELCSLAKTFGQPSYRGDQIFSWLCRGVPPAEMNNLPTSFRKILESECEFRLPEIELKLVSKLDGTIKYLFRLIDGECIESVLMQYKHGNTLCISSQVGCNMGCAFCASTIGGKVRDLLPSEMIGQVIAAQKDSGMRISNIVMMGIGEPLDNYDNTLKFLRLVNHPEGLNIGYRHISLSSCGLVDKIYKLAEENLPITLSVSLHATDNKIRSSIMPVNRKWDIHALMRACAFYFEKTGRRISFEYTLLPGKNDRAEDADALASLLHRYMKPEGAPLHVNLIPVNVVAECGIASGTRAAAEAFAKVLEKRGISATVRRRLGSDIHAACGQLRRQNKKKV